jgi:hypothetical protein
LGTLCKGPECQLSIDNQRECFCDGAPVGHLAGSEGNSGYLDRPAEIDGDIRVVAIIPRRPLSRWLPAAIS